MVHRASKFRPNWLAVPIPVGMVWVPRDFYLNYNRGVL